MNNKNGKNPIIVGYLNGAHYNNLVSCYTFYLTSVEDDASMDFVFGDAEAEYVSVNKDNPGAKELFDDQYTWMKHLVAIEFERDDRNYWRSVSVTLVEEDSPKELKTVNFGDADFRREIHEREKQIQIMRNTEIYITNRYGSGNGRITRRYEVITSDHGEFDYDYYK